MAFLASAGYSPSKTNSSQVTQAIQSGALTYAADTSGSANTVTVTLAPVPPAYKTGMMLLIKIANTNSGPTNINANGLGNIPVQFKGTALVGGEFQVGQFALVAYNAGVFQIISVFSSTSQIFSGATTGGSANAQTCSTTPSSYTLNAGNIITFTAGFTNTGATTLNAQSTGAITIKKNGSSGLIDLAAGDIVATDSYQVQYNGTFYVLLSSSLTPSSFFQVANNLSEGNPLTMRTNMGALAIADGPCVGSSSGLIAQWASNTTATLAAKEIILEDGSGNIHKAKSVSVTFSTGSTGANGLGTSTTLMANQWLFKYIIYNGTTVASLLDKSATSPALPAGYTFSALVGVALTDAGSNLIGYKQYGKDVRYTPGNNLTALPSMATGVTSGWQAVPVAAFVPSIAGSIVVTAGVLATGVSAGDFAVAPNPNYSNPYNVSNTPPPIQFGSTTANVGVTSTVEMMLESADIYYFNNLYSSGYVSCYGFKLQ